MIYDWSEERTVISDWSKGSMVISDWSVGRLAISDWPLGRLVIFFIGQREELQLIQFSSIQCTLSQSSYA